MRDLPQPQWGHPQEIAHEPVGVTESPSGQVGSAGSDQGDWPGPGAPAPGAGITLGGAGSSPPPGRPPAVGRRDARRRGPGRLARWLVPSAALIVLALVAGVWVGLRATGGGTSQLALSGNGTNASSGKSPSASPGKSPAASAGKSPAVAASPSASSSMNMGVQVGTGDSGPDTLAGVLGAANNSVEGKGLLPPAKCGEYKQNADGAIVCTSPVPGVAEVYYQNYSSLTALYDAYKSLVSGLDGGTFRQNTGTCGNSAVSYAEFGWNQEEGHPHDFTVAQMASGKVSQIFAAGRMACFETRTKQGVSQDIVWTIDGGPALGVAIGSGSTRAVYQLWASLHHAVLFRGTEMCGTAERMNLHDIPTGNLQVIPVCPPGVEAFSSS